MSNKLEKIKRKLRNLKQNKNISEEELTKLAEKKLQQEELLGSLTFCLDTEKKYALNLLENYLAEASFENFSERDTLFQLVGLEVLAERIKKFLKKEAEKDNPSIPLQMVDQLTNLNSQALELKEKLGLIKKIEEKTNLVETMASLKKKALKYYSEHAGCNILKCPNCQELFMVLMKVKDLEAKKLPWFKGTILYNYELYDLYHKKIITKQKMAKIFEISEFYVDYCYETIYLKEENKEC